MKTSREKFTIDMKIHKSKVDKLQIKIALALKHENLKKAAYFSKVLVRSWSAALVAVHRVITNKGGKTPGIFKDVPKTNEDYIQLAKTAYYKVRKPNSYKASPLRRIYILKADGVSLRPISIPSYLDRTMQAIYDLALKVYMEHTSDPKSYGFRPGRSIGWASQALQLALNGKDRGIKVVAELDIEGCFDNIDHKFILEHIPIVPKHILSEWLKCGYVTLTGDKLAKHPTISGVPQGGLISPTICNLVLNGLDNYIKSRMCTLASLADQQMTKSGRGGKKQYTISSITARPAYYSNSFWLKSFSIFRYADDMVFVTRNIGQAAIIMELISEFLAIRGLKLKASKTFIHKLDKRLNFDFVGFRFSIHVLDELNTHCMITPSDKNIRSFKSKIKAALKSSRALPHFIKKANPIISGWCYAFCCGNVSKLYGYLNKWLYLLITKWLRRRKGWSVHRINKHLAESKELLTRATIQEEWFWYRKYSKRGHQRVLLNRPSTYHVQTYGVPDSLNYFDPHDRDKLLRKALQARPSFRQKILEKQKCLCGYCLSPILTDFDIHHKLPVAWGGTNSISNLVALCREPCHAQVTRAVARFPTTKIDCQNFIDAGILVIPGNLL